MKLRELLSGLKYHAFTGDPDTEIGGVAYDSRQVSAGCLFVAIRGMQSDGNRFVDEALLKGAAGIISAMPSPGPIAKVWIQVDDERAALAVLAGNLYGHPTRKLHLVGVTGTNGKTTTAWLIESILRAAGNPAAVLGTIEYRGPGFDMTAERTTPEASDLERLFRKVVDAGWQYAVMEVSSHAIEMKRVSGLHFEVAVFTNLSRDHLDFHGDMESYFRAKKKLFEGLNGERPRVMVLNGDDVRYEELRAIDPAAVISFGMGDSANIYPLHYQSGPEATDVSYQTPAGEMTMHTSLMGKPNLYNIGAAIGVALSLGIGKDPIQRGVSEIPQVPGRFELIRSGQSFRVVVDYAHTDDALAKVLQSAREITKGRVIVVFGCGGERDRSKRPMMGQVAAHASDYAVVTSDNPRGEDPLSIIQDIEKGMKGASYKVIADRREAIQAALVEARADDTVVIAGKGHETYQTVGRNTYPFDDRTVAREVLHELVAGRN